jgi:hypothetical protein
VAAARRNTPSSAVRARPARASQASPLLSDWQAETSIATTRVSGGQSVRIGFSSLADADGQGKERADP